MFNWKTWMVVVSGIMIVPRLQVQGPPAGSQVENAPMFKLGERLSTAPQAPEISCKPSQRDQAETRPLIGTGGLRPAIPVR